MAQNYLRVLPVPGRLVPHPEAITAPQMAVVGHSPFVDGETRIDPFSGTPVEVTKFRAGDEPVLVPEPYPGYFFRTMIRDGDLAYVDTVYAHGTSAERREVDATLAKQTAGNADAAAALRAWHARRLPGNRPKR